jgi:hypothetical protein
VEAEQLRNQLNYFRSLFEDPLEGHMQLSNEAKRIVSRAQMYFDHRTAAEVSREEVQKRRDKMEPSEEDPASLRSLLDSPIHDYLVSIYNSMAGNYIDCNDIFLMMGKP